MTDCDIEEISDYKVLTLQGKQQERYEYECYTHNSKFFSSKESPSKCLNARGVLE